VNGPTVRVLGVPSVYLAHGKPDAILSRLGLDAEGIADEVVAFVGTSTGRTR
jgi:1-deoxy-D-xylulose-5-phosphate synthase